MDYEDKYKDLVKRLNKAREEKGVYTFNSVLDAVAPELKIDESEYERIRKGLVVIFTDFESLYLQENYSLSKEDILAWLEKQGEQKPADKVEPKFHAGEWLCENEPNNYARFIQILEIVNVQGKDRYRISRDIHNDEDIVEFDFAEKYYHKFDIQDAKDGDVLACPNDAGDRDVVFLFKSINSDEGWVFCFCASDANGCFCINNDYVGNSNSTNISPATKEQRDLLFQKMKEEGYEWDTEKKELKKIELKPDKDLQKGEDYGIDGLWHAEKILEKTLGEVEGYQSDDGILEHKCAISSIKELKKMKQQNWSEEDVTMLDSAIAFVEHSAFTTIGKGKNNVIAWLKSLKDKAQPQPNQEWSEEDKRKIDRIYSILRQAADTHAFSTSCRLIGDKECIELQDFLKSLRPQSQWKPSEEQIKLLREVQQALLGKDCHNRFVNFMYELKRLREK